MSFTVFFNCNVDNHQQLLRSFRQEKVMEMQWDLLISDFENPKTAALVKENMRRVSDGSSTHCADTLKLGLKRAFDLRTCVKLKCDNGNCTWYKNPVSISSIGPDTSYCPVCISRGQGCKYLSCTYCGQKVIGYRASCEKCARRFL